MKISARNQFPGKITQVNEGAVNAIVTLDVNGTPLTGTISIAAVHELGLQPGKEAFAVVKATEVMIGLEKVRISARNQLPGKIVRIQEGAVNAIVTLEVCGGLQATATISMAAVQELELRVGASAVAIIKATSVMFGVAD